MADPLLAAGTKLGPYEIIAHLASGGMGSVFRARNRITGAERALKVMLPELAQHPNFVSRFVRELRLAASVSHPNLVRVFDPGIEGNLLYLPMELLEGETLAARLKRVHRLSEAELTSVLRPVGSAVMKLHEKGILHRDLKPSNIFLVSTDGGIVPKVLDLGASKSMWAPPEDTATVGAIGSAYYMAPEQACGLPDLDGRVDQYSLGVIAYKALTGTHPYEADDSGHPFAKLIKGASFRRPREIAGDISESVEGTVLRAMSHDRDKRFPTLAEFLDALDENEALTQIAPAARPYEVVDPVVRTAPRIPPRHTAGKIWAIGALAIALAIGLVVHKITSRSEGHAAAPASDPSATVAPNSPAREVSPATVATAAATGTSSAPLRSQKLLKATAAPVTPTHATEASASPQKVCVPTPGAPCLP